MDSEDCILVAYILKEDEDTFFSVLEEHNCFCPETDLSKHGNIWIVDVAVGEDVYERFNKISKHGTQSGRGFRRNGGRKIKICFSTAFQSMTDSEALSCV